MSASAEEISPEATGRALECSLTLLLFLGGRGPLRDLVRMVRRDSRGSLSEDEVLQVLALGEEIGFWVRLGRNLHLGRRGWDSIATSYKGGLS